MNLCKVSVLMALMLAMSCYAQDAAAPDEEMDDMNMGAMNMGEPVLDAIAELAPSDFDEIATLIASEALPPTTTIIEAESPAAVEAVEMALSPYGINATAPGPDLQAMIAALSPEDTLSLVEDVSSILAALGPADVEEISVTTAGRKLK